MFNGFIFSFSSSIVKKCNHSFLIWHLLLTKKIKAFNKLSCLCCCVNRRHYNIAATFQVPLSPHCAANVRPCSRHLSIHQWARCPPGAGGHRNRVEWRQTAEIKYRVESQLKERVALDVKEASGGIGEMQSTTEMHAKSIIHSGFIIHPSSFWF